MTRRPLPLVFERLAEAYRGRPGYPETLATQLLGLAPPGARVVDLGAGTGHLAEPLARGGAQVVAVEPSKAMLAVCAKRVQGLHVALVCASAESTGLPSQSAELVVLADVAQWVDPEAAGTETGRLLVSGGIAVTVEPRSADTPFMREFESLLREANPERRPQAPGRGRQWLALASGGARVRAVELAQAVALAPDALEALLRSFSFLEPALGPQRMEALLQRARLLAQRLGGAHWERVLTVAWAKKRPV